MSVAVVRDGRPGRRPALPVARSFDREDPVLVRAMVGLLSNTLKKAVRRGELAKVATADRAAYWRLA